MPTRYIGDGYWEIISRQMSIVTRSEQQRFKDSKIAVIGCGGIGGQTIEMLARMGVGELNLVDEDAFDLSNLNRQTLVTVNDLGLDKSEVAREKIRLINPYVEVNSFKKHVNTENVIEIAKYLKNVGAKNYVLQKYFDHDKSVIPYSNEKMTEMKDECNEINYYHSNQSGSYSIKKTLPLFTNLKYTDLEVQNGTQALVEYSKYEHMTDEQRLRAYNALILYCQQDTWAMVEILKGLRKLVE